MIWKSLKISCVVNGVSGIEMLPRSRASFRGIKGFNAPDDTMEGPRASFFRSSGRGGHREEIATGFRGLTQEFAEFRRYGVYKPNEIMGSSFEDSDYQPYEEIDRGNVMLTLGDFMKLKPPSFSGVKSKEDPQVFLDEMDKIYTTLGCSSHRAVELIGFRLTEVAQIWFDMLKRCRPSSSASFTWEEFTQAFMDRFLPESVRYAKAQEFKTLMQAPGMTIILVFQRFTSYPEVVDAARKIEAGHREVGVEREGSKRNRGEGSSRYRDPSSGKDTNIVGQPGRSDGNLLKGSAFSSPLNQRRNFQFRSPPRNNDFSGINYRMAMSSGMTNSNPRGIGHVKRDCPTHRHSQEMARGSIRPDFAIAPTRNVKRDKGKGVASSS
ncbi:Retrotransposon gag domain - like 10 [Theobroma cacao]|nr:Retrotransposon gag domain - like 10 [Theobroma cacao]